MRVLLGIDQGSSATKAVLLSANDSSILWSGHLPVATTLRSADEIEQDPEELLASVEQLLLNGVAVARRNHWRIDAMGLATQRSGVLAWSTPHGQVLHPLLTHRDTRMRPVMEEKRCYADEVRSLSGLPMLPGYAAAKIAMLQKQFPDTCDLVATLDAYLAWRLSKGRIFCTDHSMASRSQLYGLASGAWDARLCEIFAAAPTRLPTIVPSCSEFAMIEGIPLRAMVGDQQGALYGAIGESNGIVVNLGTIASVLVASAAPPTTESDVLRAVFYSELDPRGELRVLPLIECVLPRCATFVEAHVGEIGREAIAEDLSTIVGDMTAYFGMDCPSLNEQPEGCRNVASSPLTRNDKRYPVLALLHLAAQLAALVAEIDRYSTSPRAITATGGLAQSESLLTLTSAMIGRPIAVPEEHHMTARGAALLAGRSTGGGAEVPAFRGGRTTQESSASFVTWCRNYYNHWRTLHGTMKQGGGGAQYEF